jgi:hypothetical protein
VFPGKKKETVCKKMSSEGESKEKTPPKNEKKKKKKVALRATEQKTAFGPGEKQAGGQDCVSKKTNRALVPQTPKPATTTTNQPSKTVTITRRISFFFGFKKPLKCDGLKISQQKRFFQPCSLSLLSLTKKKATD